MMAPLRGMANRLALCRERTVPSPEKGQAAQTTWPLGLKLSGRRRTAGDDYFVYAGAGGGGGASLFCAQAPRPNALAATAAIMIILTNFTINSPPSLAGCCRLFRRGNQRVQRNSRPFFRSRSRPRRQAAPDRRAQSDRRSSSGCNRDWPAGQSPLRGSYRGCK